MSKGFTITEVIVVLGILAILMATTAPVAWEFWQRVEIRSEYQNYLSYLKIARAQALANKNQAAHGVYISSTGATIFEGSSYNGRNQTQDLFFPKSPIVNFSGSTEIVFGALAGTSTVSTVTLSNAATTTTITINSEGKIE